MLEFDLSMISSDGCRRHIVYRPYSSELVWADSNTPVDLAGIGRKYEQDLCWPEVHPVSPQCPSGKVQTIRVLKIQLGLKCNYTCVYCNQAEGRHEAIDTSDSDAFVTGLPRWFDGGTDGQGGGVNIQFWGGEPMVYWKTLKALAIKLRQHYPNARFSVITNGSLLDADKINALDELGFSVTISHDGPAYHAMRGDDPLENPEMLKWISQLYERLYPVGRIGFNCVLTRENYSLDAIRQHIADRLGVDPNDINLGTEEVVTPYNQGGVTVGLVDEDEQRHLMHRVVSDVLFGSAWLVSSVRRKVDDFVESVASRRPVQALGQKCGMDNADNIAVDLKGRVSTCQNVPASGRHHIGTVFDFDAIRLTTAFHFTTRTECMACPVVQLCKGSCMYLEGEIWNRACDNAFAYNTALLAVALYELTGNILISIKGERLRRREGPALFETGLDSLFGLKPAEP